MRHRHALFAALAAVAICAVACPGPGPGAGADDIAQAVSGAGVRVGRWQCFGDPDQPPCLGSLELTDMDMVSATSGWAVGSTAPHGLSSTAERR